MKSLLLINVLLSLSIASYQPLLSGDAQLSAIVTADELINHIEAASVSEDKVQIRWENNTDNSDLIFFIQKSTDGINFLTFGSLRGSSSKSYAFFDRLPEKNIKVHYRIKVVSLSDDSLSQFSKVISFEHNWETKLHSTQNETEWTLSLPQQIGEQATLQIMNSMGQMVLNRKLSNIYTKNLHIPTQSLMRGTYVVQLISGDNRWTTRILKN